MDKQDNASQGSSINSGAGSWAPARADPDVFDEVFGGPCWTESCPTPKDCFHCLVCATRNELRVAGPPTCSYRQPCENANANPSPTTIPVFALRPPTPTILRESPSPIPMTSPAKHPRLSPATLRVSPSLPTIEDEIRSDFQLIELKSTVNDTCDSNSYTSLNQLKIPADTEGFGDTKQYYPPDFRPASVTPTNLSPLPKSPTSSFSTCESEDSPMHWPEFSVSVEDIALWQHFDLLCIGAMQRL